MAIVTAELRSRQGNLAAASTAFSDAKYPRLNYFVQDGGSSDSTSKFCVHTVQRLACAGAPDGAQAQAIIMPFAHLFKASDGPISNSG